VGVIADEMGQKWENPVGVEQAFVAYFSNLFTSGHVEGLDYCLQSLEGRVDSGMNEALTKNFLVKEVHATLFQMTPLKVIGLDGLNARFFQKNWAPMGEEICCVVLDILNSGVMPTFFNKTFVALIPKIKHPTCVTEFRPISLCNVLYKLISKVLANSLKKLLPTIIAPTQSTFIPGCLIMDNILAAYETLHTMNTSMKGKKGYMAIKLDMSKAYDRVEWLFWKR
jgi:hypothetical protein